MTDYEIYLFSGTGNTLRCGQELLCALENAGARASLTRVENGSERATAAGDLILGYPVHGFGAPQVILDFAKGLPGGDKNVYIFKTSGEPLRINDDSSHTLRKILTKKGYRVRGEYHYVMPYNMIFRHSDAMAAKMFFAAKRRIERDATEIVEGKTKEKKILLRARLAYVVNRIERPGVRFNGLFFRVRKKDCVRCNVCVKNCPVGNIVVKGGKFRFKNKCILCARCAFLCPKDAIRIGLMDFLRVNGKYDFSADPAKAVVGRYCRRSYVRYFSETDER